MPISQLGPYRIERVLGRGGMGAVYAGVHEQTGQRTAIKVLSEVLNADPRFRERFRGEVETLKRLRHPNIVTLIGYGEEEGLLYFVMELVEGTSLEAELQAGRRFEWREVVGIATQVCAALKHAHDHGIIHRDLKPANLLTLADGTVKLTDFGIAKLFGSTSLTLAGSMIGTPDYMSPEQADGTAVTARTDLYSLGCVMYALLTGSPPFSGGGVTRVLERLRTREAIPVRNVAPLTPPELESIIAQLLRKDPRQRIATAQLLANLLQAMQHALAQRESQLDTVAEGNPKLAPPCDPSLGLPPASGSGSFPSTSSSPLTGSGSAPPETERTAWSRRGPDTASRETLDYLPEPLKEIQRAASSGTHFTAVSERELPNAIAETERRSSRMAGRLSIAVLATALVAVIAVTLIGTRPPSADSLFQQLRSLNAAEPRPAALADRLDEFLRLYPSDPRAAEVSRWRDEVSCDWLRAELTNKLRTLSELERDYLAGMELVDSRRWEEARATFAGIVESLQGRDDNPTDRRLRDRSQKMIEIITRR